MKKDNNNQYKNVDKLITIKYTAVTWATIFKTHLLSDIHPSIMSAVHTHLLS